MLGDRSAALERLLAYARDRPRSLALWLAIGAGLLALPSLTLGLFPLDDPDHRRLILSHLHGTAAAGHAWYDLYRIVPDNAVRGAVERYAGIRPWWSLPEMHIGFFRPLAVLTHYFDYALYPSQLWLMHLHSVLWYCAAVFCIALVCLRFSSDPRIGAIGALLYAVDDAHLQPIAWLAHRNSLIATVLAALGLLLHDDHAKQARPRRAWLSGVCLFAAFLSVENAVSILGFIAAYTLFLDERPWSRRLLALVPSGLATCVWFGLRRGLGYGVYGSGYYLDPFGDPAGFWASLPERYLGVLARQFGAPWERIDVVPEAFLRALDVLGAWVIWPALIVYVVRNLDRNRELRFWLCAGLLAIVPLTAAPPDARLLALAGVAFWMVTAHLIGSLLRVIAAQATALSLRALAIVVLSALVLAHLLVAPAALAVGCYRFRASSAPDLTAAVLGNSPALRNTDVVVVNATDAVLAGLIPVARMAAGMVAPRHDHVLGVSMDEVEVTRTGTNSFELYTPPGYLLDTFTRFWRAPTLPMQQGDRVKVMGFLAQVVRLTADRRPLRVRFSFDVPLDDPSLRFLVWNGHAFADFHFAPIGQRRVIPASFDHTNQLPEEFIH